MRRLFLIAISLIQFVALTIGALMINQLISKRKERRYIDASIRRSL